MFVEEFEKSIRKIKIKDTLILSFIESILILSKNYDKRNDVTAFHYETISKKMINIYFNLFEKFSSVPQYNDESKIKLIYFLFQIKNTEHYSEEYEKTVNSLISFFKTEKFKKEFEQLDCENYFNYSKNHEYLFTLSDNCLQILDNYEQLHDLIIYRWVLFCDSLLNDEQVKPMSLWKKEKVRKLYFDVLKKGKRIKRLIDYNSGNDKKKDVGEVPVYIIELFDEYMELLNSFSFEDWISVVSFYKNKHLKPYWKYGLAISILNKKKYKYDVTYKQAFYGYTILQLLLENDYPFNSLQKELIVKISRILKFEYSIK